jgi:3'(2'), 5'-bisphosphate nucleotidase
MYAGFTDRDGAKVAVRVIAETGRDKPMQVRRTPHAGLTVMASTQYPIGGVMDQFLAEYKVEKVVKRASSLKICAIAAGKADLYPRFGRTGEWDTAAGDAILRAAGGLIKGYENREALRYGLRAPQFENPAFIAAAAGLF